MSNKPVPPHPRRPCHISVSVTPSLFPCFCSSLPADCSDVLTHTLGLLPCLFAVLGPPSSPTSFLVDHHHLLQLPRITRDSDPRLSSAVPLSQLQHYSFISITTFHMVASAAYRR